MKYEIVIQESVATIASFNTCPVTLFIKTIKLKYPLLQ
jgi:hypothetical protein